MQPLLVIGFLLSINSAHASPELVEAFRLIDDFWERGAFEIECKSNNRYPEYFKIEKEVLFPPVVWIKQGVNWKELDADISDAGIRIRDKRSLSYGQLSKLVDPADVTVEPENLKSLLRWSGLAGVLSDSKSVPESLVVEHEIDFLTGRMKSKRPRFETSQDSVWRDEVELDWTGFKQEITRQTRIIKKSQSDLAVYFDLFEKGEVPNIYTLGATVPDYSYFSLLLDVSKEYKAKVAEGRFPPLDYCFPDSSTSYDSTRECAWSFGEKADFFFPHVFGFNADSVIQERLPEVMDIIDEVEQIRSSMTSILLTKLDETRRATFSFDLKFIGWRDLQNKELIEFNSRKYCKRL